MTLLAWWALDSYSLAETTEELKGQIQIFNEFFKEFYIGRSIPQNERDLNERFIQIHDLLRVYKNIWVNSTVYLENIKRLNSEISQIERDTNLNIPEENLIKILKVCVEFLQAVQLPQIQWDVSEWVDIVLQLA
jgi:hypothetical protein